MGEDLYKRGLREEASPIQRKYICACIVFPLPFRKWEDDEEEKEKTNKYLVNFKLPPNNRLKQKEKATLRRQNANTMQQPQNQSDVFL